MSFYRKLESTLFFFGFKECKNRDDLSFLRLSKQDYLVMRIFKNVELADLTYAKFSNECTPCDDDPFWEKVIKLGFSPETDNQLISDYLKLFEEK
jgi:hypothetical protein